MKASTGSGTKAKGLRPIPKKVLGFAEGFPQPAALDTMTRGLPFERRSGLSARRLFVRKIKEVLRLSAPRLRQIFRICSIGSDTSHEYSAAG
jgi:hypothetical protein